MIPNRFDALEIVRTLSPEQREAVCLVITTADVQGDYQHGGDSSDDSVWCDNTQSTLDSLAEEIKETV